MKNKIVKVDKDKVKDLDEVLILKNKKKDKKNANRSIDSIPVAGRATLVGGTVTVSTTAAKAGSRFSLTVHTPGGT